jgi:hypothetical protein
MKYFLFFLFLLIGNLCLLSQKKINFYEIIDTNKIKANLMVISHDSLEGRNTGEKGLNKAANYIVDKLKEYGCKPFENKFFQTYNLLNKSKSGEININGKTLHFPADFGFNGEYNKIEKRVENFEIIAINDLSKLNSNKNYIVKIENISDVDEFLIPNDYKGTVFFITKNYNSSYFTRQTKGLTLIKEERKVLKIYINEKSLKKHTLKKILSNKKINCNISLNKTKELIETQNINAFIEGSDSLLKKEVVIISAHYDHIGVENNEVFNGADDNGSGTTAVLEMARIFQMLKNKEALFKRSILFLWFSGEEHGLLGSDYYSKNPLIPLSNTITNLNIDMIGRKDTILEKEKELIYIVGGNRNSVDLHQINEQSNDDKLTLDYKYNDVNDLLRLYFRSDHYNFAKNNIPCIFYFGGFHEDYHQASDEIDKIDFEKIKKVTNLVCNTTFNLLNSESRPVFNK